MTATRNKPVAAMLGDSGILNSAVLSKVRRLMREDVAHVAFLGPPYQKDSVSDMLIRYLIGAGEIEMAESAESAFRTRTSQDPRLVEVTVIDTSLPFGDSFKDGDYTELEALFPNLKKIIFACNHMRGKLIDIDMPGAEVEFGI